MLNNGESYDLIYLDIEMKNVNGVEVGQQIRRVQKDYTTEIVYISGKDGYDRELFDVQPLNFISKPIDESVVIKNLVLALERIPKKKEFFQFSKQYYTYKIPIDNIIYFESRGRKISIVTTKEIYSFYDTLDSVELKLTGQKFIRIHRSFLINYNHVSVMHYKKVIMTNDTTLPVSRSKQQVLRDMQANKL